MGKKRESRTLRAWEWDGEEQGRGLGVCTETGNREPQRLPILLTCQKEMGDLLSGEAWLSCRGHRQLSFPESFGNGVGEGEEKEAFL